MTFNRHPSDVFSPAGYADALFHAVGLRPFLAREHSTRMLGVGMAALHGGACGIRVRRVSWLPVAYLDMTSQYAAAASRAGAWDLLRAERVTEHDEDPAAFSQLLRGVTVENLLSDPALWRRLARTFCHVTAAWDVLPHRVAAQKRWQSKVAPLAHREPLAWNGAHIAASVLQTGRVPHITECFTLQADGQQALRPITLPSGLQVNPNQEDILLALAVDRLLTHPRHDRAAKIIISAVCFGLLCQVNVSQAGMSERMIVIDQAGDEHTRWVDPAEEPGRWSAPPIAAAVTATAHLMLTCARVLYTQAGGFVAYWDTDSLIGVCTADGGLVPCPGGSARTTGGEEAVMALSYEEVDRIRRQMERISPYPAAVSPGEPTLLGLESENYDAAGERQPLYLWSTATKNYDLYSGTADGGITLEKASEHGLGHMEPPEGAPDFIAIGKAHTLRQHLALDTEPPEWWDICALSIITLATPAEIRLAQAAEDAYAAAQGEVPRRVMPYSRLAVAHPIAQYARRPDGSRITPVAPHHQGFNPAQALWRNLSTGDPLSIRPVTYNLTVDDLRHIEGRVLIKTLGAAFAANQRRHDPTMTTATGQACRADTAGAIAERPTEAYRAELISKETRNLDRAGITEDPAYTSLLDPFEAAWHHHYLPCLRRLAPDLVGRGRPSYAARRMLAARAGELATAALSRRSVGASPLTDAEQACYRYLSSGDVVIAIG
jgi:hypothetical protein